AFEWDGPWELVHFEAILRKPGAKPGFLRLALGMKKTAQDGCAPSQYGGICSEDEVWKSGHRGQKRHLGELADDCAERGPLLHGYARDGVVHISFHPWIDHVSDREVIGRTHQV